MNHQSHDHSQLQQLAKLQSVARAMEQFESTFGADQHEADLSTPTNQRAAREDFGRKLRLAMECQNDQPRSNVRDVDISDAQSVARELIHLARSENSSLATQIELLVKFDELEGWRIAGAKNCISWMNLELGIDRRTSSERLRVGRALAVLPVIQRLFKNGRLSYSKVRELTRFATPENEKALAHASLDASVTDVQRLRHQYYWDEELDEVANNENALAMLQHDRRRLTWQTLSDGNLQLTIVLPPEKAQFVLNSLEHCEHLLFNEECNEESPVVNDDQTTATAPPEILPSQRKADALVMMAESSLAYSGSDLTQADRYQVVLNIDSRTLVHKQASSDRQTAVANLAQAIDSSAAVSVGTQEPQRPVERPFIEGAGPVPLPVAREITCDCSLTTILSDQGDPLSIGRKSRIWQPSMRRSIVLRDRHCQFPGCNSHRHLHIHHIKHWADGGETSVDNGVCLCPYHHRLIHTGEFSIERATVPNPGERSNKPKGEITQGLFSSHKKRLLPTRCRFVVKRVNSISVTPSVSASDHIHHAEQRSMSTVSNAKDKNYTQYDNENINADITMRDDNACPMKTVRGSHRAHMGHQGADRHFSSEKYSPRENK